MSFPKRRFQSKYVPYSVGSALLGAVALTVLFSCTNQEAKAKPNLVFKEAPKPGIVARINGQDITEEELIGDDRLDFFDLKRRR